MLCDRNKHAPRFHFEVQDKSEREPLNVFPSIGPAARSEKRTKDISIKSKMLIM